MKTSNYNIQSKSFYRVGIFFLLCFFGSSILNASNEIKLQVTPNHADWKYKIGEKVLFKISIDGNSGKSVSVYYQIGTEMMPPVKKASILLNDSIWIDGGTMHIPGFLRCIAIAKVNGIEYRQLATAAFEPEQIAPTVSMPKDFEKFWKKVRQQAGKVPLNTSMVPMHHRSNLTTDVYAVAYQNQKPGDWFYAVVCIPKKQGKYPAVIRFPGAGYRPLDGHVELAEKGMITLDIYIHRYPVTNQVGFYDSLSYNVLRGYMFAGIQNRDSFYYNRVISGCIKAIDFIYSLPKFDGKRLAAWGSSQGGFLAMATTALDKRIKSIVAVCPAMSDLTGYLYNRAGGWPHVFAPENIGKYDQQKVKKAMEYYDVVNFARILKAPGFFTSGFNDEVTPPTTFYAAYNQVKASKEIFIVPWGTHSIYPEQNEKTFQWFTERFK